MTLWTTSLPRSHNLMKISLLLTGCFVLFVCTSKEIEYSTSVIQHCAKTRLRESHQQNQLKVRDDVASVRMGVKYSSQLVRGKQCIYRGRIVNYGASEQFYKAQHNKFQVIFHLVLRRVSVYMHQQYHTGYSIQMQ